MSIYKSDGTVIILDSNIGTVVDVTSFGAVGDGITDDYSSIQSAINSISETGGTIFFPSGTYKISHFLVVYSNQTIELNGSTILQGGAINNLMQGYCTSSIGAYNGPHDIIVQNGTFDGGNYTTNNTLLGFCHGKNITIRNCSFKNGYGTWHNIEINSSKWVVIDNCIFEGSRRTGDSAEMVQVDSYDNDATWPWNNGAIDNTISYLVEIKNCHFYNNTISPAVGNHSNTSTGYTRVHDCTFEGLTSGRGVVAFLQATKVDIYDCTFIDCTKVNTSSIGSLHDNRIDGTTTVGTTGTVYNNIINGTLTV